MANDEELGWEVVGSLEITSGRLWAGDPYVANEEDGVVVDLPPGEYVVEAVMVTATDDEEDYSWASRVRVRSADSDANVVERGEDCGDTGTDSALLALCDAAAIAPNPDSDDDEAFQTGMEEALEEFPDDDISYEVTLTLSDRTAEFIVVKTGGDGGGPAYALTESGSTVGVELELTPEE